MKINKIPAHILTDVRARDFSDAEIEKLSAKEIFKQYCEWNGLINWYDTLWDAVLDLKKIEDGE